MPARAVGAAGRLERCGPGRRVGQPRSPRYRSVAVRRSRRALELGARTARPRRPPSARRAATIAAPAAASGAVERARRAPAAPAGARCSAAPAPRGTGAAPGGSCGRPATAGGRGTAAARPPVRRRAPRPPAETRRRARRRPRRRAVPAPRRPASIRLRRPPRGRSPRRLPSPPPSSASASTWKPRSAERGHLAVRPRPGASGTAPGSRSPRAGWSCPARWRRGSRRRRRRLALEVGEVAKAPGDQAPKPHFSMEESLGSPVQPGCPSISTPKISTVTVALLSPMVEIGEPKVTVSSPPAANGRELWLLPSTRKYAVVQLRWRRPYGRSGPPGRLR